MAETAFDELIKPYRHELLLHCYRLLCPLTDAEDVLQESLLAAWRGLDDFQGRASPRKWLYRIATKRCLNALRDRGRRIPPAPKPPFQPPGPSRHGDVLWLQPFPDALLEHVPDTAPGPETRYTAREAVELAFIAALQRLPPRQAAALVLCDVLGYPLGEVAPMSTPLPPPSKDCYSGREPHSPSTATPTRRRPSQGRRRNGTWSAASPRHSPPTISTRWSACSPTTRGWPCRPRRTNTRCRGDRPHSCTRVPHGALDGAYDYGPLAPTGSLHSAATSSTLSNNPPG